ncbi:hypothetical protein P0Y31_13365 [Knoellia sp. 3-2P3]|uniref:hypothetical protein n=1 Tax=unclassified Knoellia TaxID=2618719 RepID=UPI0023DC24A6|nr:hypothetical protein [Knoellia sp. 3-2P3]MDF2093334.1 hypothetical protein [Knoellia sp. 3-2P3]
MNTTVDPVFAAALRRELVALPAAKPRRTRRRVAIVTGGTIGVFALGGVAAVANLRPAGEIATPALAAPVIVNGVGPATVALPAAPRDATYVRIELACYDGLRCATPGGSVEGPNSPDYTKVQRDALPLTSATDPSNAQVLAPVDPAKGIPVDVDAGTHWRLYAVYTDRLNPKSAPVGDGRILGIPSNTEMPDLVPAVANNGKSGWVDYHQLTDQAKPTLTDIGTSQAPIPVYEDDGRTIIGNIDVSRPRS